LETDASHKAIGALIMQEGEALAYMSKPPGKKKQGLSIYAPGAAILYFSCHQMFSLLD